jgi:hypothetical protein
MKKILLNETERKVIILEREKAIVESFAKTFNKIKRIDENDLEDYEAVSRSVEYGINPYQDQPEMQNTPSFDEINWDKNDYEIEEIIDPPYTADGTMFGELNGKRYSVSVTLNNIGGGDWEVTDINDKNDIYDSN